MVYKKYGRGTANFAVPLPFFVNCFLLCGNGNTATETFQSCSTACAAAIKEYYNKNGISIFVDYRYYPNQLIYHKVFDVLNK